MRRFMSWTFSKSSRMYNEIMEWGHKIYQLGEFDYIVLKDGTIVHHWTSPNPDGDTRTQDWKDYHNNKLAEIRAKHPHIKFYLCIRNDGFYSIFEALFNNTNGAQDKFVAEINRIIDENPYITGIDFDLEHGGGRENREKILALFSRISETVWARGLKVHYDLPGMTAPYTTVGNENWCAYEDLDPLMDSCTIMSYGMAWAGSAPSAISPKNWLESIYDYAVTAFDPSKIFMGLPAYGFRWQIYDTPSNRGEPYRGETSGTYLMFLYWMLGAYNHNDPQPKIPFVGYWDDYQKSSYLLLHVYDLQDVSNWISHTYPVTAGEYNNKKFFTAYTQAQKTNFDNIVGEKYVSTLDGTDWNITGAITEGGDYVSAREPEPLYNQDGTVGGYEEEGVASAQLNISSAGEYDIVLQVQFPWWDANKVDITIDGQLFTAEQPSQWYPLARKTHWFKVGTMYLSAGTHTIAFKGGTSAHKARLYGVRACSNFSYIMDSGNATFKMKPATFKDAEGNPAQAVNGYKLTLETLRRAPEYALIWSDDWRGYAPQDGYTGWSSTLFKNYYDIVGGEWEVQGEYMLPATLVQKVPLGTAKIKLSYNDFTDLRVRAVFSFNGTEAGIVMGNIKIGLRNGQARLYVNGNLYSTASVDTDGGNILVAKCRSGNLDVSLNRETIFTFSGAVTNDYGFYTQDATAECSALEAFDANWLIKREGITVTTPAGTEKLGHLERTGVTVDDTNNAIYVPHGMEEYSTRTEDISMDWDFLHTQAWTENGEVDITINADHAGVWIGKLYLIDQDGASICYYADMNHYNYWLNEAQYRWGLQGIGVWAIGQQDPNFYKYLPSN